MIALEITQADLPPEEREDLQPNEEPVDMRVGNLSRRLEAVDRQIVSLKFKMRRTPAELLQLHAAAGRLRQFGNHHAAHLVLEPRCIHIPCGNANQNKNHYKSPQRGEERQIPQPMAAP